MVVIEVVLSFGVIISGDEIVCDFEGEGFVMAILIGGILLFIYNWSNGSFVVFIGNLLEGIYIVMVIDVFGCIVIEFIDIEIVDDFIFDIIVINLFCLEDENGSIFVEGWGGIFFYIY